MLIAHAGKTPVIDPTAWVAPDATVAGDVGIGPDCRVLWGARIIGEGGGTIRLGRACIVMENAALRATPRHPCTIGDFCLVGPQAHVVGAAIGDEVFIATGAAVFHGARLGKGAEVRIRATVHLRTRLAPGTVVPIGWVAVGDPARILPPDHHDAIWEVQRPLDFPGFVYGLGRETPELMRHITERLAEMLGRHRDDRVEER
jgi:carbonic anhydrase/acetyltransferase-like protein (isoleucine patch superfamily)